MRSRIRGRLRAWATVGVTLAVVAGTAAAAPAENPHSDLSPDITAIMNKPAYEHAEWGMLEIDPENGRVIHSMHPNQFFMPGSTIKLITISSAWHALGPDHRFTTPVNAIGQLNGSTLTGNLALVAQGDLTMGGRTKPDGSVDFTPIDHTYADDVPGATLTPEDPLAGLDQIAQQVRDSGITTVDGDVVIDSRLFAPPPISPTPTPLIINDNVIDLLSTPTSPGQPAQLSWRPQVAPYQVTSNVQTVAAGGTTDIQVAASPDGTNITLSGTIAADAQPTLKISQVQDPNAFGRTALIEALGRAGVTVTAPPTGPNPDSTLPASYTGDPQVAAFVSPQYRDYAKLILNVSHNLGANLALCNMAANIGSKNCFDAFPVIHDFLANTAKVDPTQFEMADGRGDVPVDRVTATGLNQLLAYWLHTPDADAFRTSLPILGVSGTGALYCTTNCPAKGKVFAKPGTIIGFDELNQGFAINAQTYAGYLQADDGHLYTFFIGVNGAAAPNIQGFFDVNDDVDQIAVILQQEACADRGAGRSQHKAVPSTRREKAPTG
ncbi:D-alanyl-D-alanine carboxypeptidase/D-alanyl-D-alanine-endopeptidase (penicillin-binding protein 4) [Kitasatospora sp. MAA4]|uniref:D-alanyl-D-alanine carboxypeptidase/D-alanyl-D-alanine endopeptidase n=1 Tax=Kitasatospora sp. MAA4 TaxID=3035093 RepID=UPI00247626F0|nr:D-alanyl-D-alanine carboxypeptidase/D-alanyl-D-alanine-endopeptidase [Kitasatospora sp. MAA4]MDH6137487.1 D-alanyl-D-alanine carboxypeptidase/D-alanyl-D-alanine-endopeptidase (penicillin-binding protein 4) [Kitasatospora sp. MAA4]